MEHAIAIADRRTGHRGGSLSTDFSPDGTILVTRPQKDTVARLYDARTGTLRHTLGGHAGLVTETVFSPDGRVLATYADGGPVKLWDPRTGAALRDLPISLSENDTTVRLWDAASGAHIRDLHGSGGPITSMFAPRSGGVFATQDTTYIVDLWDQHDGTRLATFKARTGDVQSTGFTGDGRALVLGDEAGEITVYDIASRTRAISFPGSGSPVAGLEFSPRGDFAGTTKNDGHVRIWSSTSARTWPGAEMLGQDGYAGRRAAASPSSRAMSS